MSPGLFGLLVAAAISVAGVAVLALAYLAMSSWDSARMRKRLRAGAPEVGEFDGGRSELMKSLASRGKKLEALVDTNKESARLLIQAGWRTQNQRAAYYASQVIAPLALIGVAVLVWLVGPEKLRHGPVIILMVAGGLMLGLLLPRMYLRSTASSRRMRMKKEVPLFVHLLILLFEAGLTTRQAMASLVREGPGVLPELGREFELALRQIEAGADIADVLTHLSAGFDLDDFGSVLALLRQVDRYGGEVRDPLLEALKVIEERRSMDMRELVNILSGRMTVVMVLFFFPALLIFTAGPAAVSVLSTLGQAAGR